MSLLRPWIPLSLSVGIACSCAAHAQKTVNSATDLPRFDFPLSQPASTFLTANEAEFLPFAIKVEATIDSVISGYTINDKETLRELVGAKLAAQLLRGEAGDALKSVDELRGLEEKPAAKLSSGLLTRAMAQANLDSGAWSGQAYDEAFQRHYHEAIDPLPWATVQENVKGVRTSLELLALSNLVSAAKNDLDPEVAKTGGVDLPGAEELLSMRLASRLEIPISKSALAVLQPYIETHNVQKPDIWPTREVTLTAEDKTTPVRIAIFDSGIDTALYPGQLFVDPKPGAHSPHGLAFDMHGNLTNGDLQPVNPDQKDAYPKWIAVAQGFDNLENGIDSAAATEVRKTLAETPADQLAPLMKRFEFLSQYMHGTHVAGIAVRGNPAARLMVVQFYDSLPEIPFPPTVAWAEKFKEDFHEVGVYLHRNNVRVVNMSWGDDVAEIEQWLDRTSTEKDAEKRKEQAKQIYAVWREAVEGAIEAAPDTLWICAAGNSDSNASFLGDVPASIELQNLISIGAVDQAGDETSFTSYGKTVVLYADGFQVESYVPGGTRLKESGTSMASPNAVNLAAKLIALDPKLTPKETAALMEEGATTSSDGRLKIINPKASVELLRKQIAAK
jgi:subtilisin family serine protease